MFCNSWCNNNSTNFNNNSCGCNRCNSCGWNNSPSGCGCNRCGCNGCGQRSNNGCGWYTCPCGCNNFFWLPSTVNNQAPPTTPTVNIGYFTNPSAASIAANGIIPVALTRQIGQQITSSGTGALLPVGVYDVSYALSGTPAATPTPTPETVTAGVQLNGATVPALSQSESASSTDTPYNISSSGFVEVTSPNSILTLNNLGASTQNYTDVNLVIRKLA